MLQNILISVGNNKDDWFKIELINIILGVWENRDVRTK